MRKEWAYFFQKIRKPPGANFPNWFLMGMRPVLGLALLLVLFPTGSVQAASTHTTRYQATPSELISEVNALRASNGLPPYSVNSILMGTAQGQANFMAATGTVTHSGPGGITTTQRLLEAGYPLAGDLSLGGFRSENITAGPNKTAAQAVLEWQGDAPHLNTMLSPNLTEIGAGVAVVGDMVYLVIDCARPTTSGEQPAYTPASGGEESGESAPSPGDFIVPIVTSTPDADGRVYHDVQYGQTLWAIAVAYDATIDEIRSLNGLGSTTDIYQGDTLLIREGQPPASGSTRQPQSVLSPTATSVPPTSLEFATPFSVITETVPTNSTETPPVGSASHEALNAENDNTIGITIGIILLAILLAGLFTWMSTHKPA